MSGFNWLLATQEEVKEELVRYEELAKQYPGANIEAHVDYLRSLLSGEE